MPPQSGNSTLHRARPGPNQILAAAQRQGFSLMELMIAVVVGSAVLFSVGQVLMAQIEISRVTEVKQRLRDNWSRVAQFIESEIIQSERVLTDPAAIIAKAGDANNLCGYSSSQIRMALVQPDPGDIIIYWVKPVASGDTQWRGPNVLLRCGQLNSSGGLSGVFSDQVLTDGIKDGDTGFQPLIPSQALGGLSTSSRHVSVLLTLTTPSGSATYGARFGGQARLNAAYNFLSDYANQGSLNLCAKTGILCGSGTLEFTDVNCPVTPTRSACDLSFTHQYYPSGSGTINGSSLHEDVIYFPGRMGPDAAGTPAHFTISNPCTRQLCLVTKTSSGAITTIVDGDLLVVQDGELRF